VHDSFANGAEEQALENVLVLAADDDKVSVLLECLGRDDSGRVATACTMRASMRSSCSRSFASRSAAA
jgi:hypothetical protein